MKTVFTDLSTIAHMWANQLQSNARNSGNFFFENDTIYSYGRHFPIAKHVKNANGIDAVLFTQKHYSNTTAKHKSIVIQACNHLNIIYCDTPSVYEHSSNFEEWTRTAENISRHLLNAKKPAKYLAEIASVKDIAEKYANFFDLSLPATLTAILSIGNKEQYAEYSANKEQIAAQAKKAAELANAIKHKKELAKWLKGESRRLYTRNGYDYLRVSGDNVETSQAVDIPIKTAIILYNKIKDGKLAAGDKVLQFTVDKVGTEIKIGCHNFKKSYLIAFGAKLKAIS